MLGIGDKAPQVQGKLGGGGELSLSDFQGKRHVVLYFFPKDFTPG